METWVQEIVSPFVNDLCRDYNVMVPILSGGLDSVVMTGLFLEKGKKVYPVFFNRDQSNLIREEESVDFFDELFGTLYSEKYHPMLYLMRIFDKL